jgi:hypothetical protein
MRGGAGWMILDVFLGRTNKTGGIGLDLYIFSAMICKNEGVCQEKVNIFLSTMPKTGGSLKKTTI